MLLPLTLPHGIMQDHAATSLDSAPAKPPLPCKATTKPDKTMP